MAIENMDIDGISKYSYPEALLMVVFPVARGQVNLKQVPVHPWIKRYLSLIVARSGACGESAGS